MSDAIYFNVIGSSQEEPVYWIILLIDELHIYSIWIYILEYLEDSTA